MSSENGDGFKVIHASLYRMGTGSIAKAYQTLGYKTHHVLDTPSPYCDWAALNRAVDGKWPGLPGAWTRVRPRPPFTRADWEAVRGDHDIFTDFTSHFSIDLIRAYPEAKVVVAQRDFDSWWASYKPQCVDTIKGPTMYVLNVLAVLAMGYSPLETTRKQFCGFYGVRHVDDIDANVARKAYDEFFAEIRRIVPPERRLEFTVRDGWAPLCEFLGREVPDMPFPHVNEAAGHQKKLDDLVWWWNFWTRGFLAVAVGVLLWFVLGWM